MDTVDDILAWLDNEEPVVSETRTIRSGTLTSSASSGMCFEINREVLLSLLEKVLGAVPSRDLIPVLTNLQIRLFPEKLEIVASSTDIAIKVSTTQVQTITPGVELFPAKTFSSIIRETIPGSTVYVETTPAGLVVVAGSYTAEIALTNLKGFPDMENISAVEFHPVNRLAFLNSVMAVKYALPGRDYSGQDSMRMISIKGGKFTACDGSRFQQVRIEDFRLNMQLPAFSVGLLIKVLGYGDQEVLEIGETEKKLVFRVANTVVYLNKLESPYPNVEQLWLRPALSNDMELVVNKSDLIKAIKQVRVATDTQSYSVKLELEETSVKVVAKDINKAAHATVVAQWGGKSRTVVVNYLHLAEMLKAFPRDECRFFLGKDSKTHKSPLLLKDDETNAIATMAQMAG